MKIRVRLTIGLLLGGHLVLPIHHEQAQLGPLGQIRSLVCDDAPTHPPVLRRIAMVWNPTDYLSFCGADGT